MVEDQRAAQQAHLARLATVERYPEIRFANANRLAVDMLRAKLQDIPALAGAVTKPVRLGGLVDLEAVSRRGFAVYLGADKPYYSRSQHLRTKPAPEGCTVETEEELLELLDRNAATGLIITGDGGVGKTRLTLELGRMAVECEWVVKRVENRFTPQQLDELKLQVPKDRPALLVIDYAETYPHFARLCQAIDDINQAEGCRFHYVASCRTSYWPLLQSTSGIHRVDLMGMSDSGRTGWYAEYRGATVRHILEGAGFKAPEIDLKNIENLPIFSVFVVYLAEQLPKSYEVEGVAVGLTSEEFAE